MGQGLQAVNYQENMAVWVARIKACRASDMTVGQWCKENGVSTPTFYRWQRRIFEIATKQNEPHFAEVTPPLRQSSSVAVTVCIGAAELQVHNGADASTVEMVLRLLKSC